MQLEETKSELLEKISRNILLFQQLEGLLKFLVIKKEISGSTSTISDNAERRKITIGRLTLGNVAGAFFEDNTQDTDSRLLDDVKEAQFSFRWDIEYDNPDWQQRKQDLKSLVQERNELVHQFLHRVDLNSLESMKNASTYLDEQRSRIVLQLEHFRDLIKFYKEKMAPQIIEMINLAFRELDKTELKN
jgi:hypothetical protein